MPKKINLEFFIKKSKIIHGDKYDYSLVVYINSRTKVKIICKKHGVFEQKPNSHLSGCGCQKCYGNTLKTNEQFIKEAKQIHGDKYDYSLVEYINSYTKVKIICKKHGVFEQKPNSHLNGDGCLKCCDKTKETFIDDAKLIHGNKYDYSLVEYINCYTKVKIICKKHGVFEQTPNNHLSGQCCPKCNSSKGENIIEQHFKPIQFNGISKEKAQQNFINNKIKDNIKENYCKQNNISLVRISYKNLENSFNIFEREFLCKLKM